VLRGAVQSPQSVELAASGWSTHARPDEHRRIEAFGPPAPDKLDVDPPAVRAIGVFRW
jgi:hypothetical protein